MDKKVVILVEKKNVYGRELTYPVTFKKPLEVLTGKQTIDETDIKALTEMGFLVCTQEELLAAQLSVFLSNAA